MNAHKVSLFSVVSLGLLALAQSAQAGSMIHCSSQIMDAVTIKIDRSSGVMTGEVDGINLLPGHIKTAAGQKSGVLSLEFDTGMVVHKVTHGALKKTRIQGRLDLNSSDPERSIIHSEKFDSSCGGFGVGNHCVGGYDVLQSDAGPIAYEMSCHVSK